MHERDVFCVHLHIWSIQGVYSIFGGHLWLSHTFCPKYAQCQFIPRYIVLDQTRSSIIPETAKKNPNVSTIIMHLFWLWNPSLCYGGFTKWNASDPWCAPYLL